MYVCMPCLYISYVYTCMLLLQERAKEQVIESFDIFKQMERSIQIRSTDGAVVAQDRASQQYHQKITYPISPLYACHPPSCTFFFTPYVFIIVPVRFLVICWSVRTFLIMNNQLLPYIIFAVLSVPIMVKNLLPCLIICVYFILHIIICMQQRSIILCADTER